jgi:hypothetical protein
MSYHLVCCIVGNTNPTEKEVFSVVSSDLTQERLEHSYNTVLAIYRALCQKEENVDAVAKGPEYLTDIRKTVQGPPPPLIAAGLLVSETLHPKMKIKDILNTAEFKW